MNCDKCGKEIRRNDGYCPHCGSKQDYDPNFGFSIPQKATGEKKKTKKYLIIAIIAIVIIIMIILFFEIIKPLIQEWIRELFKQIEHSDPFPLPIE
ncbi:MAG: hypothetical protein Q4B40_06940 [Clostridia bacterium]|nr:hypothetical protein [Clostridia bacterium]